MTSLTQYILSVLMTLLPQRYRTDEGLRGPAVVSSALQILLSFFALLLRLLSFASHDPGLPRAVAGVMFAKYDDAGLMETGPFLLVRFWMKPANAAILYFFINGVVRIVSALAAHQVLGTA